MRGGESVRPKRIGEAAMKTRFRFKHRLDKLDADGEIVEHLAGIEDSQLAAATYEAAVKRWPKERIMLRQEARVMARVIHDSKRRGLVKK
jgi:hypothetical protein